MSETVAQRALVRIREEMFNEKKSQEELSDLVKWTPSRLSKVLNGVIELTVNDMAALCQALGIQPTEAVRDRGLEFCAEMTPTELRVLERFREKTQDVQDAYVTMLDAQDAEPRGATKKKSLFGKPRAR